MSKAHTGGGVTNDQIMATLSEFADSVERRFEQQDKRFEQHDGQFARMTMQFEQLRQMMIDHKQDNDEKFNREDEKFDRILTILDGMAGRMDIDDTERVSLSSQVDRHEDWIDEAAPIVGVTYDPSASA